MKNLNVKPLGSFSMKSVKASWFLVNLLIVIGLCMSACSKDDDGDVIPVFPEQQKISCQANDEKELSFEANMNWKLTSSVTWCKFMANGVEEYSLSGNAGKQTVTIKVTDENQGFEESTAKLELTMGTDKAIIAEVTRLAKNYELKVFDTDGNEIQTIEVGYKNYIEFAVEANFDFAATDKPEWMEFEAGSMVGSANQKVTGSVKITMDGTREKYPISASSENVIVFANQAGTASFPIQVFYKGMDADEIEIGGNTPWNWTVSLDGQEFSQTSGLGDPVSHTGGIDYTIKALNDQYEYLFVQVSNGKIYVIDDDTNWMKVEEDNNTKGKVKVKVDPFTPSPWGNPSRTGCIFVFPKEIYGAAIAEIEDGSDFNEIATAYQHNILMNVTQKAASTGFIIKKDGWETVSCTKETDTSILELLQGEYFIDEVYTITAGPEEYYLVCPELEQFGADKDGGTLGTWEATTATNEEIDPAILGGLGIGGMEGDFYSIEVTTPADFTGPIIIRFIDATWQNKKALVIRPN